MSEQSKNFEQSLSRLDEIVKRMERGDVPLQEALQLFEEGTGLVASCNQLLDEAELKVVQLTKGADGNPQETVFTDE
ncbi:MAG: exodeoxyribonuclease VII small subunit [Ruminococcaceae bacterium]|nr:exodeoxyribonuclease VII small subunit [Oscillospiraceae bacterium]